VRLVRENWTSLVPGVSLYSEGLMPEWIKILITAVVSFSAAVLLDAVKDWRARRRTVRIVADVINILALQMSLFLAARQGAHGPNNPLTQTPSFDTDRYDHAYEKDPHDPLPAAELGLA